MVVTFGGQNINRPGAYSVVDSEALTPISVGSFRVLAIVGGDGSTTTGIDATKVNYFSTQTVKSARTLIGTSGANAYLMDLMNIAWAHGADLIAVSIVTGTGASNAIQDVDWQTAIDRLITEDVDGMLLASSTPAIQAKLDTHVQSMSAVALKRERRGFYGHPAGLSASSVAALQATFNNERAVMATPAVKYYAADGKTVVLKDSVYLSAAYAGLWAGGQPQDPITYKYVKFPGVEKVYTPDDIDTLLAAHIAPCEYVAGKGIRIVQGVTTSSADDLTETELSVSTLKDVMSRNMRDILEERYVGKAGTAGIEVTIYNDVITIIEGYKTNGWITGYDPEKVLVTREGTAFYVDWEGKPTLPINNFLITSHFTL